MVLGDAQFLSDMSVFGDALLEVTGAFGINYSILGNADPALHAHIHPRYVREPEPARRAPVRLGKPGDGGTASL